MSKMVKKEKDDIFKYRSLKKVLVFVLVVFLLLIISVFINLFYIAKDSKYNGRDQYTVSVIATTDKSSVIFFNPENKSISHVIMNGDRKNISPGRLLGVLIDSNINLNEDLKSYSVSQILLKAFIHPGNRKQNITAIDIVRLFMFSRSLSASGYNEESINLSSSNYRLGNIERLLMDMNIIKERKSIEIVNGTNVSGLGKRLETVLKNIGCNVVAVNASIEEVEKSEIIVTDNDSYTLKKLQRNLRYPIKITDNHDIADIKIVIGSNGVRDNVF